jgi:hypothetical protein
MGRQWASLPCGLDLGVEPCRNVSRDAAPPRALDLDHALILGDAPGPLEL